eukprot:1037284-Rhodomonas_salina.1
MQQPLLDLPSLFGRRVNVPKHLLFVIQNCWCHVASLQYPTPPCSEARLSEPPYSKFLNCLDVWSVRVPRSGRLVVPSLVDGDRGR